MSENINTVGINDIVVMHGPYKFTKEEILRVVQSPNSNGNYRTGVLNSQQGFVPHYVGRGNVFSRLNAHIDAGSPDTHFKFIYEQDEFESYRIESADYDYFGGIYKQLRNREHPKKPDGVSDVVVCQYCGR